MSVPVVGVCCSLLLLRSPAQLDYRKRGRYVFLRIRTNA